MGKLGFMQIAHRRATLNTNITLNYYMEIANLQNNKKPIPSVAVLYGLFKLFGSKFIFSLYLAKYTFAYI